MKLHIFSSNSSSRAGAVASELLAMEEKLIARVLLAARGESEAQRAVSERQRQRHIQTVVIPRLCCASLEVRPLTPFTQAQDKGVEARVRQLCRDMGLAPEDSGAESVKSKVGGPRQRFFPCF